jgi:hypothetical protein
MEQIPSWLLSKQQRESLQPAEYDVADSFHNAPGWRLPHADFYTCVAPADRPIDPVVLRWIHTFDPGLIPIWRKQLYLAPGAQKPILVTHHGIARHVRDPKGARRLFHVEMPSNAKHPQPNLLEAILEEEDLCMLHEGGPGKFQRFDMWLYRMLRKQYNVSKSPKEVVAAIMKRKDEERERAREARKREEEYRQRAINRFVASRIDSISESDVRRHWDRIRNRPTRPSVYVKGVM